MKVTWRIDLRRWVIGVYADSLTVAIFIGPIVIDFLYRWDQVKEMWLDDA